MPQNPVSVNEKHEESSSRNWLGLASTLTERLKQEPNQNTVERSTRYENLGYFLYRASMQSREQGEFLEKIRGSIRAYKTAARSYRAYGREGEAFRSQAMEAYLAQWTARTVPDLKRPLCNAGRLKYRYRQSYTNTPNENG